MVNIKIKFTEIYFLKRIKHRFIIQKFQFNVFYGEEMFFGKKMTFQSYLILNFIV